MKGSIRIVLGLLLTLGGVGGIEADTSNTVLPLAPTLIAFLGLAVMAWGTLACNREMN